MWVVSCSDTIGMASEWSAAWCGWYLAVVLEAWLQSGMQPGVGGIMQWY